jgi:hypothetical protein
MSGYMQPINWNEVIVRAFKYIIEGLAVAAALFLIRHRLNLDEILIVAATASAVFAILDTFTPSIGSYMRQGTGMGLGFNFVGFPGGAV